MEFLEIKLNPNPLVQFLGKAPADFTRLDIIKFIEEKGIRHLNFRYIAEDGRLKTLNFIIHSKAYLESILATGERVDGSSLFSYVEPGKSDLYVIPRFQTAFINPFSENKAIEMLCSFYTRDGHPVETAPENVLKKAIANFEQSTGFQFKAMGELEYYVISEKKAMYPAQDQKAYHESSPFANWEHIRLEAMDLIAQCGGKIKYGHSEVGNFKTETEDFEQHEIEFLPVSPDQAVEQLLISKWILRMLGNKYGVKISFAPKITVGKAGSGMHIHMLLEKNGENIMIKDDVLSDSAKKMIAGLLDLSPALTAFGNTNPTSYLRLVPHQEAPTNICWGDSNRSVLVRVPLGWIAKTSMISDANPQQNEAIPYIPGKQTVEFRAPDGSADLYHLMASLIVAAKHGLKMNNALKLAEKLYVNVNIFAPENKEKLDELNQLPASCWESAEALNKLRKYLEADNIFPEATINRFIKHLKSFNDKNLSEELFEKNDEIKALVERFVHAM